MGKRRKSRELALQFLYQLDLNSGDDPAPHEDEFWSRHPVDAEARAFADGLVRGTKQNQPKIDHLIYDVAEGEKLGVLRVLLDGRDESESVLVFGRTKHGVKKLAQRLAAGAFEVQPFRQMFHRVPMLGKPGGERRWSGSDF